MHPGRAFVSYFFGVIALVLAVVFLANYAGWIVATLAVVALAAIAASYLSRPIIALHDIALAARYVRAGNYSVKVPVSRSPAESAAHAFNHMIDRLKSEVNQLQREGEQLRMILTSMVEGVVAIDAEQIILFANRNAIDLFRLPADSAGRKLWELIRDREVNRLVVQALEGQSPCKTDLALGGGSELRHLSIHVAGLPGTPPRGAVLVAHDTTELKRLEQLRQEFVANVSHELKTPLTVISACAETLMDSADGDSSHRVQFLERIVQQSQRLTELIVDLLSLARAESSATVLNWRAMAVRPLIDQCVARHHERSLAKGVPLEALGPPSDDLSIWADEEAVRQILDNLVDNALKFTARGGRVCLRWHGNESQVIIEVADTGMGIPDSDLPRIFERFYRVDKARSRDLGGSGLGLAIVKHHVMALQGEVAASSKVGVGSVFTVRLQRPMSSSSEIHRNFENSSLNHMNHEQTQGISHRG